MSLYAKPMTKLRSHVYVLTSLFVLNSAIWAQYKGHGGDSLSAAQLKQFAPKPVDAELQQKIQKRMDIHGYSSGRVDEKGESLYFNWTVTGTSQVWKLAAPKAFPQQLTAGEDATVLVDVAPNGEFLVLSRDKKGDEYPGLYLQSTKGGELTTIFAKSKVQSLYGAMSPDSRYLYFRANDKSPEDYTIYRYDMQSKKVEELYSGKGYWDLDDRFEDGTLLLSKWTGGASSEYYTFNEKTKELTTLFGQGESFEFKASFGRSSQEIIVLTNKWSDFRRIYRFDGKDSKGKWSPITEEVKKDIEGFSVHSKSGRLLLTWNDQGYNRPQAIDLKSGKTLQLPEFKDAEHVSIGSTTYNGTYSSLAVQYATRPRSLLVYNWNKKKITEWMTPTIPEINISNFTKNTLEFYDAADGTKVPMFVKRPKQCERKLCPVIVDFHGGPEAQSVPGFYPLDELFAEEGFVRVEPNVRGSDGYGKKWLDADNGVKRLDVITDIRDCVRYIKKNWAIDGKAPKVGVEGGSYGGYSTLMAMTYFAGEYDAGAATVGMSSLITFLQNTAPYRRILRESEYGYLNKDMKALKELSPITHIQKAKGPLLVLQGASDPRVPAGEAVQIYNAWMKKKLPVELVIFADEGHGVRKRNNRVAATAAKLAFFKKYLKD